MVARGDLGVEVALETVPRIQKSTILRARHHGKFVVTATQMLESMIDDPMPTRAEVSDVANAIYEGTNAIMLSAESPVGKYPVEAVKFMARIATETENSIRSQGFRKRPQAPFHLCGDPRRCRLSRGEGRPHRGHRGVHRHRIERTAGLALPAARMHLCPDAPRKRRPPVDGEFTR
jgi:hypothetical protein